MEMQQITFSGHMVAVMALMEAPSIMVGLLLMTIYKKSEQGEGIVPMKKVIHHALTNGSVILIIGSLCIGFMAGEVQADGIKPFTTDIFKGFLLVFLLDMGITSGRKLSDFIKKGWFALLFAIIIPLINGCLVAVMSGVLTESVGNRLLFAILAAMKITDPKAKPSLYISMALAITFPFNITLGMPIYLFLINIT
jgi:hypothetical protein